MKPRGLFLVAVCVALAGCGGSSGTAQYVRGAKEGNHHCDGSKVAAKREVQRRRLTRGPSGTRVAAATLNARTENGNAATNRAVDRFELDVAEESIPVQERSRFIDRAAAIVAARCSLCFQALEANRPLAAGAKLACG